MTLYTPMGRASSPTDKPFNPGRRHRADFARAATIDAFGRHARALDWDDFQDRQPWQMPMRSPTARFR